MELGGCFRARRNESEIDSSFAGGGGSGQGLRWGLQSLQAKAKHTPCFPEDFMHKLVKETSR